MQSDSASLGPVELRGREEIDGWFALAERSTCFHFSQENKIREWYSCWSYGCGGEKEILSEQMVGEEVLQSLLMLF